MVHLRECGPCDALKNPLDDFAEGRTREYPRVAPKSEPVSIFEGVTEG